MALPLVVPSFVYALVAGTALGPRGLVQQALEALFGVSELPSIYGFPGALLALALLTYPYVLLPTDCGTCGALIPRSRRSAAVSAVALGEHSPP